MAVLEPFGYESDARTGWSVSNQPTGRWSRGKLPDQMLPQAGFALPRPKVMREPGTWLGTTGPTVNLSA